MSGFNFENVLVGMTLEAAEAYLKPRKIDYRLVYNDGPMMITCDYHPNRLNLTVKDGIVMEVKNG